MNFFLCRNKTLQKVCELSRNTSIFIMDQLFIKIDFNNSQKKRFFSVNIQKTFPLDTTHMWEINMALSGRLFILFPSFYILINYEKSEINFIFSRELLKMLGWISISFYKIVKFMFMRLLDGLWEELITWLE